MCDLEVPVPAVGDYLRPPLVTAEKKNAIIRKSRTRDVASRYKSGISSTQPSVPAMSRRSTSPNAGRVSADSAGPMPKRAQSAERRRPSTPPMLRHSAPSSPLGRPSTPTRPSIVYPEFPAKGPITPARDSVTEKNNYARRFSGRAADGLWPSVRSLSLSFQSESISVTVSKKDGILTGNYSPDRALKSSVNVNNERKKTPIRGRNDSERSENSRPVDNSHARVIDQRRGSSIISLNSLTKSIAFNEKANKSTSTQHLLRGISPKRTLLLDGLSKTVDLTDKANRAASSSVRGFSPRTSTSDHASRGVQRLTGDRAERMPSDGSEGVRHDVPAQPSERTISVSAPSRTQSLSVPGFNRHSSPSRALTTQNFGRSHPLSPKKTSSSTILTRGLVSPSRTRPLTPFSHSGSRTTEGATTSSILNYITDARKGNKNANHLEDRRQLRLLYNRNLHWRFVNAKLDLVLSSQEITAENALYSVWNSMSQLHGAVALKMMKVHRLKQEMKLNFILKEQIAYLEEWASLESEHCDSMSGAIEALQASTLRLPVTGGAKADVRAVKCAVSSAVDAMQAMGSSVCHLLSKVEAIKCAASELSVLANKEKTMLDKCRELLASAASIQVQESSLRTQLLQLRQDTAMLK